MLGCQCSAMQKGRLCRPFCMAGKGGKHAGKFLSHEKFYRTLDKQIVFVVY